MIGEAEGWWRFGGEATGALADTQRFIAEREVNLVGFTALSYFAFIAFMGVTISAGAIGQLWRRQWGLGLIGVYLLSHAALFVNFMTVNPKIFLWALTVVMAGVLVWAGRVPEGGAGRLEFDRVARKSIDIPRLLSDDRPHPSAPLKGSDFLLCFAVPPPFPQRKRQSGCFQRRSAGGAGTSGWPKH